MPLIALPRTAGCIVCGPSNPHGLQLASQVDTASAAIQTRFIPASHHIGFDGLIHGGILSTVVDEAMVWAAIWASRRACVAGELSVRFRRPTAPGDVLTVIATVTRSKGRLLETASSMVNAAGDDVLTATAKYLAGTPDETAAFFRTLLPDPAAAQAIAHLCDGAGPT